MSSYFPAKNVLLFFLLFRLRDFGSKKIYYSPEHCFFPRKIETKYIYISREWKLCFKSRILFSGNFLNCVFTLFFARRGEMAICWRDALCVGKKSRKIIKILLSAKQIDRSRNYAVIKAFFVPNNFATRVSLMIQKKNQEHLPIFTPSWGVS